MSNPSQNGGSTLSLILLMISCVMCMSISISSVGSVLVSNAEPPPDSSSLESQLGFSIEEPEPDTSSLEEPEPDTSSLESQIGSSIEEPESMDTFDIEPEEVEKHTFKLLRNKDYSASNLYHYSPTSTIPFTETRCFHECSVNPNCKAVVFTSSMDRCWGKMMADFELPLHRSSGASLAYVKKDLYEEAVEKYG